MKGDGVKPQYDPNEDYPGRTDAWDDNVRYLNTHIEPVKGLDDMERELFAQSDDNSRDKKHRKPTPEVPKYVQVGAGVGASIIIALTTVTIVVGLIRLIMFLAGGI